MEEARTVLDRLTRIEALDRRSTPPQVLLAEVRALLAEAEAWLEAERADPPQVRRALERTRAALERPHAPRVPVEAKPGQVASLGF